MKGIIYVLVSAIKDQFYIYSTSVMMKNSNFNTIKTLEKDHAPSNFDPYLNLNVHAILKN